MRTPFNSLALALVLVTGASAMAAEVPYDAASFQRLLASGAPVAVDFHADWCPTCRAQAPLLQSIEKEPEFQNLTLLVANFDTEKELRKNLKVSKQSTLVVFRHGKEVARSTGDTTRSGLTKLLETAVQ